MDTLMIGFLVGIVASTVSVLLIVRLTGEKLIPQRIAPASKRQQLVRATASPRKRSKSRRAKPKPIHKLRMKPQPRPDVARLGTPPIAPAQLAFSSCPACGLQAPEKLMAEHFMGSPSHQYGPIQPVATVALNTTQEEASVEEDSQNSVRSLLQILVPPRAFGRRHAHRTVSPLSNLVETTRDSGHTSFRP